MCLHYTTTSVFKSKGFALAKQIQICLFLLYIKIMNISTRRLLTSNNLKYGGINTTHIPIFLCICQYPAKRKAKNHEKLAGFGREFIDSKTSKKSAISRIFGDLQGVKNAPRELLLSGRSEVRISQGVPKAQPKSLVKSRFFGAFLFLRRNSKNEKSQIFIIGQQIHL